MRGEKLKVDIRRVCESNYGVYGARKGVAPAKPEGIVVVPCTVERLMAQRW